MMDNNPTNTSAPQPTDEELAAMRRQLMEVTSEDDDTPFVVDDRTQGETSADEPANDVYDEFDDEVDTRDDSEYYADDDEVYADEYTEAYTDATEAEAEEDADELPVEPEEENLSEQLLGTMLAQDESDSMSDAGEEIDLRELARRLDINPKKVLYVVGPILILMACFFGIAIGLGYQSDKLRNNHTTLVKERQKWHDLALTRKSELTARLRQSRIEEQLKIFGDSTLVPGIESVYIIPTEQ
ncbi:MAG: hypothetical protein HUK02_01190 [Bacteroidaceae bacterium]|nr:hypothetical protein [Bacteroidaceae bacterium]